MNDILFSKKIKEREAEQLRSSSAQRLIEKLSLLRNRRDASRRRWFWELLQNASDYNDNVNVELIVDDEKVVFKHDGLPFIDTDVFNLIRPDSNKNTRKGRFFAERSGRAERLLCTFCYGVNNQEYMDSSSDRNSSMLTTGTEGKGISFNTLK